MSQDMERRALLLEKQMGMAVHEAVHSTPRALQQADHRIGVSDIGSCREYARLMITQQPPTDEQNKWPAFIGTALGDAIEEAVAAQFPEARRKTEVTITLPVSGAQVTGHPDLLLPNAVIDIKTTASLSAVKRLGPSQSHQFQRHGYYFGALQNGLITTDDGWVANAYFDRTGETEVPYVHVEEFREDVIVAMDEWVSDVIYAVRHGEKASKDKPIAWCAKSCPFFSVCRGEDIKAEGLIEDPEIMAAVLTYLEGRDMRRQGTKMEDDAKRALAGIRGQAGGFTVSWIHVNESDVPGFTRKGYDKIDVRKVIGT